MPAVWTYPWNLADEGLEAACADLADRGIDALNLASHYHSIRSLDARRPESLFSAYPGGCYFDPDPERFAGTLISPLRNAVPGFDDRDGDPVTETVATAADYDISVNAWTVCLHNSRLGANNPTYRIESAFGDAHDHAFCPSHPAVREYFAAVVEALRERGAGEIHLESIGFQSPFHEHGHRWGHPKRQTLPGRTEEALLAQCFCDGCRAAAAEGSINLDQARSVVREYLRKWLTVPNADPPSLDALVSREPVLADLFSFRAAVVEQFVARLAEVSESTPLSYYAMEGHLGADTRKLWPAGVRLEDLTPHLDRALAICYVADPGRARERVRSLREAVGPSVTIDAGLTLDPAIVPDEGTFAALVGAVREEIDGTVSVYHHGLATDAHLAMLERTFGG